MLGRVLAMIDALVLGMRIGRRSGLGECRNGEGKRDRADNRLHAKISEI
jgi:hypothetical protein